MNRIADTWKTHDTHSWEDLEAQLSWHTDVLTSMYQPQDPMNYDLSFKDSSADDSSCASEISYEEFMSIVPQSAEKPLNLSITILDPHSNYQLPKKVHRGHQRATTLRQRSCSKRGSLNLEKSIVKELVHKELVDRQWPTASAQWIVNQAANQLKAIQRKC